MQEDIQFFTLIKESEIFMNQLNSKEKIIIEFMYEIEKTQHEVINLYVIPSHFRVITLLKHGKKALSCITDSTFEAIYMPKEIIDSLSEMIQFEIKKLNMMVAFGSSDMKKRAVKRTTSDGYEINVIENFDGFEEIAEKETRMTITKRLSSI